MDLGLSPVGREVGKAIKSVAGRDNRAAVTAMMHSAVNEHLGIKSGQRGTRTQNKMKMRWQRSMRSAIRYVLRYKRGSEDNGESQRYFDPCFGRRSSASAQMPARFNRLISKGERCLVVKTNPTNDDYSYSVEQRS